MGDPGVSLSLKDVEMEGLKEGNFVTLFCLIFSFCTCHVDFTYLT